MDKTDNTRYRENGYKPVLCKGYHPKYNPKHDYKIAKQPKDEGFTSKVYVGPTDEIIDKWISEGGWVGWVLPEGVLVVDYDDGTDDEQLIESTYLKSRINPGIAKTNKGKQAVFKDPGGISGIEQYSKLGPLVCHRIGGKNQCIWPPINGRTWEVWQDTKDLPDLPKELHPANNLHDYLTVLAWQLGKNYRKGLIQGNDDLDLSCMAYLAEELKLSETDACKAFSQIFGKEYDHTRTVKLYQRVNERIKNDESLRGAGTFIQALKDKGLNDIVRITAKIGSFLKGQESKQTIDILSQIFTWNEITDLDLSVEWLLEKLIPKGAITLVFCPGGGGKTWLLMQIARAIAIGEPFGELQTIQTPVYFIDFENPLVVVKERREKIGPAPNFYYWHLACPTGPRKLDSAEWEDYKQLPAPGLIIFDTLRASHLGDENSSKDMALVLSRLKELREAGFTIVILHHTPKGNDGTYKGSTAILDLADHVLSLENTLKRDDVEFDADAIYKFGCRIKTRFEPFSTFLSFNPEIGFIPQEDPDIELMKAMQDVLKGANKKLNQTEFKQLVDAKLSIKERRARDLIKKGIGQYWTKEKSENNNAILYAPACTFVHLIKVCTNRTNQIQGLHENDKPTPQKSLNTVENQELGGLTNPSVQTVQEKLDESEYFEREVDRYLKQGLSKPEAVWLAKEGL